MKPLRIGVIGVGVIGRIHARVYSELPEIAVIGAVDPDAQARKTTADAFGIPVFAELDELLALAPDAVSLCVPTSLHETLGLRLIEAGVPILIEKPLARTVAEGERLVAAAEARGVPLMVGHIERFNPVISRIRKAVEREQVLSIQIIRVGPFPPRIQDVGVVTDLGAHDLDLVRFIAGADFATLAAVSSCTRGAHEDSALIVSRMQNGVLGQITANWITPYKSREIRVATAERYIEGNLITQQVREYSHWQGPDVAYHVRDWPPAMREPMKEELSAFLQAVREGTEMPVTGAEGLYILRAIEQVLKDDGRGHDWGADGPGGRISATDS